MVRPGLAGAGLEAEDSAPEEAAPDPLEHASADAELAEAQMALGRPERAEDSSNHAQPSDEAQPTDDQEFGEGPEMPGVFPQRPHVEHAGPGEAKSGRPGEIERGELEELERGGPEDVESDELEQVQAHAPEARARAGNRLVNFLLGSWRELQRVQWPDRRQVMQATGVVIGFVIVAGVFLGVADALSAQIVKFVLK